MHQTNRGPIIIGITLIVLIVAAVLYVSFHKKTVQEPTVAKPTLTTGLTGILNAEIPDIYSGAESGTIMLKNGKFNGGIAYYDNGSPVQTSLSLNINTATSSYLEADINADGAKDLVATVSYSTGGTGQFSNILVFISEGGVLKYRASEFLGDRITINKITFVDGMIGADIITQGPNDPMCCPTTPKIVRFSLTGTSLTEVATKTLTDGSGKISFLYPVAFPVNTSPKNQTTSWMQQSTSTGSVLGTLTIPKSFEQQTNFSDAKFTIGKSTDKQAVANCVAVPVGNPVNSSIVSVGGVQFFKFSYSEGAAGNYYDTTSYRTVRNNACYAVEYTIHSTNIGNYSPEQAIQVFDKAKITNIFENIVKTVLFI